MRVGGRGDVMRGMQSSRVVYKWRFQLKEQKNRRQLLFGRSCVLERGRSDGSVWHGIEIAHEGIGGCRLAEDSDGKRAAPPSSMI